MSQWQKLIDRLKGKPKDFTWGELERLLHGCGYEQDEGSGSRRRFFNQKTGAIISLHKPHPRKELKDYQIRDVLIHLREEGYL